MGELDGRAKISTGFTVKPQISVPSWEDVRVSFISTPISTYTTYNDAP